MRWEEIAHGASLGTAFATAVDIFFLAPLQAQMRLEVHLLQLQCWPLGSAPKTFLYWPLDQTPSLPCKEGLVQSLRPQPCVHKLDVFISW